MAVVAPSLLAANLACLGDALEIIRASGAPIIHVDVGDGHFVPDITVGQPVIASLRKATPLVLEAHLRIERPERYLADFIEAGADRVSVHAEATADLHRTLELIRRGGAKAGVALNPLTPIEWLTEALGELDFLTLLSPDSATFEAPSNPRRLERLGTAARAREEAGADFDLEVEGSLGLEHLEELTRAGADILVVDRGIFDNKDPKKQLREMIRVAASGRQVFKV